MRGEIEGRGREGREKGEEGGRERGEGSCMHSLRRRHVCVLGTFLFALGL